MLRNVLSGILVCTAAGGLFGQSARRRPVSDLVADPAVKKSLAALDAMKVPMASRLAEIAAIESPSGQEQRRAAKTAEYMRAIGLSDVIVDAAPNAIGRIPGRSGKALVFISTLDDLQTVAEHQKAAPRPPWVEGDRVIGPGSNTSSTTISMLAAAEALIGSGLRPEHDLVFAAVAQEETGMTGMKKLFQDYRERALAFVDILGDGRSISYGAIGIHWWQVKASGPGGHTLGGGLPNVNQAIGRSVDRILQLPQPEREKSSRTVLSISIINSGAVFNHKPETGWFSLDIRSTDAGVISEIEDAVRHILSQVSQETGIKLEMEPFQLTPGGQIPGAAESPLVKTSVEIARFLGLDPTLSNSGSSNMNVAVGAGVSAIGLGGNRGGERGTPKEWADVPAMVTTAKHVFLLAVAMGNCN